MKMPVLFIGHGSPMEAISNSSYSQAWEEMGKKLPRPKAILAISAHWYTKGIKVSKQETLKQVYDMYGFPQELYDIKYTPKGDDELTKKVLDRLPSAEVDNSWGIDHGVWSILMHMYPEADIPVVILSVDGTKTDEEQFEIGERLADLRQEGYLIIGSGNVVHNLRLVEESEEGYPWAIAFDEDIRDAITDHRWEDVVLYKARIPNALQAAPTPEHFNPLITVLGAASKDDTITVWNEGTKLGSISMTSYLFKS